jgi:hypothetical protein
MNQFLIAHVTAEVVIVGGITFYFMRKFKQTEEQIRLLESQVKDLDTKIQSADKHIQTLYQMIEGIAEQAAPPPSRRSAWAKNSSESSSQDSLRNRKHKMKIVPLPEEDILELHPIPNPSSHSMPIPILSNMGALFEMMSPGSSNPLDAFMNSVSSPQKESTVVVEDLDDDDDIQEELKELGVTPETSNSK